MTLTLVLSSQDPYTGNIMLHMFQANRIPVRQMQLRLLVACMIPAQNGYLLQACILCFLSFDLKRSTNRGKKGVHVQYFCPSDSLPHIHKCPRLPAGNWVFQGRHWTSSSWLCWGRECRSFSSSLFLGQGCKNEQNVPMVATVCHSDQSLMKRRGNEAGARVLWMTAPYKSKPDCSDFLKNFDFCSIVFSCSRVDWWIWEWAMLRLYALNLSWEASCMNEPTAYFPGTHTHKLGLTFPGQSTQVSL